VSVDVEIHRDVALLLTGTQPRRGPFAQPPIERAELLAQLGHVDHRLEHQHVERSHGFGRLLDRLPMHSRDGDQRGRAGAIAHGGIAHFGPPAIEHATHELAQQALFGSETVADQTAAVPGALADGLKRCRAKAALGDQLEGSREQTALAARCPLGLRTGRKSHYFLHFTNLLNVQQVKFIVSLEVLRYPQLVAASDAAESPRLRARRCACGYVFHPPHAFGCERCGRSGEETAPIEIDAAGVLTAFATVHVHPKLPVPFVLARVALDDGPALDVWIEGAEASLRLGQRVRGSLVSGGTNEAGETLFDLRFAPAEER